MQNDNLKGHLTEFIKNAYPKTVTVKEIEEEVRRLNVRRMAEEHKEYKLSNAERRLRQSESPMIEAVRNEKKFIIGYRYRQTEPVKPVVRETVEQGQLFTPRRIFN